MKQYFKKPYLPAAGLSVLLLLSSIVVTSLLSFSVKTYSDDVWDQLGLSRQSGDENIRESFLQGYIFNYGAKSAKNIATGNRPAVAKDLLTYTKQYISSEVFKKEYEKRRLAGKPQEPRKKTARSREEIRMELVDQTKKAIAELEKNMSTFTADVKKTMNEVLSSQKQQLKEYQDPDNELIEIMTQGEKMAVENDWKNYQQTLKKWEDENPVNPSVFIRKRLQQYLDIVNTVDFSAALKEAGGKKKFVNDNYERKSNDWKKVYRAGKEVNDVAKAFASDWVKEL